MSFKQIVEKISDNHFILPKTKEMKTEVHAFLSQDLFNKSEESVWQQIANSASYEGVIGAYLMPDCHSGFGIPIGSVVITDNTIIQAGSGYDISCGVIYAKTNIKIQDVVSKEKRRAWINAVEDRIPSGMGNKRPKLMPKFSEEQADSFIRYGAKALGINKEYCERQFIPIPEDLDLKKLDKAYEKILPQLGSTGSSNHFCELQCDRDTGEVYIMVHCGSRGFGYQTATHFFYKGAELRNLPTNRREESWLYADEPLGKEYWNYHNAAANYAIANRHIIVQCLREATQQVFNSDVEIYYEISHNLVQQETLVLPDGSTKKGFVHRKGATRAFPANHPDLKGTKWEETGHPCLIPGSMYEGAAILFPLIDSYKSGCSVNHGSGRLLARKEAKRRLTENQQIINNEMATIKRTFNGVEIEGIMSNHRDIPLDECNHVYKNLDEVLAVLEAEKIARVANRLYPIANIKDAD